MPPHRPLAALPTGIRASPRSRVRAGSSGKALLKGNPLTLGTNPVTARTGSAGAPGQDRRVPPGPAAGSLLLVIVLFDVHRPDVVVGAQHVVDAEHGGVHRVVLVV